MHGVLARVYCCGAGRLGRACAFESARVLVLIHLWMRVHNRVYRFVYMHASVCVCGKRLCVCIYVVIWIRVHCRVYMCDRAHTYVCVHVSMYQAFVCVCMRILCCVCIKERRVRQRLEEYHCSCRSIL